VIDKDPKPTANPPSEEEQRGQPVLGTAVQLAMGLGQKSGELFQLVGVKTEDGRKFPFFLQNLFTSGLRLLGTRSLIGQKVYVQVPYLEKKKSWCFPVRIVWSYRIVEGLVENGGIFLDMASLPDLS
jgi:hypothetical protein